MSSNWWNLVRSWVAGVAGIRGGGGVGALSWLVMLLFLFLWRDIFGGTGLWRSEGEMECCGGEVPSKVMILYRRSAIGGSYASPG